MNVQECEDHDRMSKKKFGRSDLRFLDDLISLIAFQDPLFYCSKCLATIFI
jgi:hypothetical protein